jgi:endo-1,3(4)-beta-glucanase
MILNRHAVSSALPLGPSPYPSQTHPMPPTALWGSISGVYPTNTWWTNLILGTGQLPIAPLPYLISTVANGIQICYPNRAVSQTAIVSVWLNDLQLGCTEQLQYRQLLDYDLLTVTMIWTNSVVGPWNPHQVQYGLQPNSMVSPIVQGSPYITMKYSNLTPALTSIHAFLTVNGQSGAGSATGVRFNIQLNNGQTWLLYALNGPLTFSWNSGAMIATTTYTGILRVACLVQTQDESALDTYSTGLPIASKVSYTVSGNSATIQFSWITETNDDPLIVALPHHMDVLVNPSTTPLSYYTIKGPTVGIIGKQWFLNEILPTLTWTAPRPIPQDKVSAIISALNGDQGFTQTNTDTYGAGKQLAAMARLVLIAEELGEMQIATNICNRLRDQLTAWFTDQTPDRIIYDRTWKGLVSSNGIANEAADYGLGWYNDHHYHWGYFAYASAVVAKNDLNWTQTFYPQIMEFIRDFANPATDGYYPVTRMKDWYAGHSWASGIVEFADNKNQESTSESVNGYYGIYLLGLALNNDQIRDLGRLLLATEIRSAQKYWQINNGSSIYESVFAQNTVVGILWSTKVDYATWFGANVEYITCIQMLPFTPMSELLLPSSWVTYTYPKLSTALTRSSPPLQEAWRGFIYMAQAIFDQSSAWNNVQTLTGFDDGNSRTNTYYWVATRP